MPNCIQCDQELNQETLNLGIDLCLDCVLENSMKSSITVSINYCIIIMSGIMFGISLIPYILNYPLILAGFEEHVVDFSLNIVISTISGTILVLYLVFWIYKKGYGKKNNLVNVKKQIN